MLVSLEVPGQSLKRARLRDEARSTLAHLPRSSSSLTFIHLLPTYLTVNTNLFSRRLICLSTAISMSNPNQQQNLLGLAYYFYRAQILRSASLIVRDPNELQDFLRTADCEEADIPHCLQQLVEEGRAANPKLTDRLSHLANDVWQRRQGDEETATLDIQASSFKSIHEACAATGVTHFDDDTWNVLEELPADLPEPINDGTRAVPQYFRTRPYPTPHCKEVGKRFLIRTLVWHRLGMLHIDRVMETLMCHDKAPCTFLSGEHAIKGYADLILSHRNIRRWDDVNWIYQLENAFFVVETKKSRHHQDALPRLAINLAAVQQARLMSGRSADVFGLSTDGTNYQFWMLDLQKRLRCSETFDWDSDEDDILSCLDFIVEAAIESLPVGRQCDCQCNGASSH